MDKCDEDERTIACAKPGLRETYINILSKMWAEAAFFAQTAILASLFFVIALFRPDNPGRSLWAEFGPFVATWATGLYSACFACPYILELRRRKAKRFAERVKP